MSKRRELTEVAVLSICRRYGVFSINPLRYRDKRNFRVLESMRKRGLLSVVRHGIDNYDYKLPAPTPEEVS